MLYFALFLATLAASAVVQKPFNRAAQPGSPIRRQVAPESAIPQVDTTLTNPVIKINVPAAALIQVAADPPLTTDLPSSSSKLAAIPGCTPSSICFDGMTCGMRYGA